MRIRIRENKIDKALGRKVKVYFKKCEGCLQKGWYEKNTINCRKCRVGYGKWKIIDS